MMKFYVTPKASPMVAYSKAFYYSNNILKNFLPSEKKGFSWGHSNHLFSINILIFFQCFVTFDPYIKYHYILYPIDI